MRRKNYVNNVPAARALRIEQTAAEERLWDALRNRQLNGLKVRRQHPVGPYVLDFCIPSLRLAIELDGPVHDDQRDADAAREAWLRQSGYDLLRFPNEAVFGDLPSVLEAIHAAASRRLPLSRASGEGVGG